eukprot:scaffold4505_cov103-Isochrysis_galbana.AAC.1
MQAPRHVLERNHQGRLGGSRAAHTAAGLPAARPVAQAGASPEGGRQRPLPLLQLQAGPACRPTRLLPHAPQLLLLHAPQPRAPQRHAPSPLAVLRLVPPVTRLRPPAARALPLGPHFHPGLQPKRLVQRLCGHPERAHLLDRLAHRQPRRPTQKHQRRSRSLRSHRAPDRCHQWVRRPLALGRRHRRSGHILVPPLLLERRPPPVRQQLCRHRLAAPLPRVRHRTSVRQFGHADGQPGPPRGRSGSDPPATTARVESRPAGRRTTGRAGPAAGSDPALRGRGARRWQRPPTPGGRGGSTARSHGGAAPGRPARLPACWQPCAAPPPSARGSSRLAVASPSRPARSASGRRAQRRPPTTLCPTRAAEPSSQGRCTRAPTRPAADGRAELIPPTQSAPRRRYRAAAPMLLPPAAPRAHGWALPAASWPTGRAGAPTAAERRATCPNQSPRVASPIRPPRYAASLQPGWESEKLCRVLPAQPRTQPAAPAAARRRRQPPPRPTPKLSLGPPPAGPAPARPDLQPTCRAGRAEARAPPCSSSDE